MIDILAVIGLGLWFFKAWAEAVGAGKAVHQGIARVVEVRDLNCEQSKLDALDEEDKKKTCWPDSRVLRVYISVTEFTNLTAEDNQRLIGEERKKEAEGIWRCNDRLYYFKDKPEVRVGGTETFQFQFFPNIIAPGGSPLIFLATCRR